MASRWHQHENNKWSLYDNKKKIVLGSAIAAAPAPTRDYWHLMTRVCPARAA